ncbi:hypothetical protein B0T22DRAFT_232295 [Podospora appendiculata]|uniref:Uncharacterized protein n=1 Tax=Podospora appendiculata TaxID=314037 RepID=A0AAE0X603_9PEZI|nr:hypothetical protein B0T22DRAFT_232295 [Podospora appendiculata]
MSSILISEPHPTVPKNSYTHSGRGGAGNFFRAPATTAPTGVLTKATTTSLPVSSNRFYSGRGGAGNAHAAVERPILSFDEEFSRAEIREKTTTMNHVGRGGAGNIFSTTDAPKKERKHSTASTASRRDSSSTNGSVRSGFWGRLSNVASHHQ